MRVSIDWLREYIDLNVPLEELADGLTMAGLEVEETIELTKEDFASQGGSGTISDTVFNVKVTPNRGDWLSMIGVAREAGPLVKAKARLPEPKISESGEASEDLIKIEIEAPDLCRRYVGVVVRGVKIKDSPGWMKDRLIAAGLRPINNVVDITNYVMLELGQPLHAFDYSLLHGGRIIVRRARPGETIASLDGAERALEPDMLVIADANRPVAIAGVMGGIDSEINEQTEDILVESANFNSVSIRRTSKRLGMTTESSYRFEREVDPSITMRAALRAAELMAELAGGQVCRGAVDVCPVPVKPIVLHVRPDRVNSMLGVEIDAHEMADCLNSIEIATSVKNGMLECRVPTFRPDVGREIDVIEEIGRVYGYDKLPVTLPETPSQGRDSREGAFHDRLRRILMSCGAQEALTHSVVDSGLARAVGRESMAVKIRNPLVEDLNSMRVMLAPNLLRLIERNQAFGNQNVSVFEIGKVYFVGASGTVGETLSVAGAMVGNFWRSAWGLPARALDVDFFACKGVVESLLDGLNICSATYVDLKDPLLHPTRCAKVLVEGREVGLLGEAAPALAESLGVRGRPCVFELDFNLLMELAPRTVKYQEPPRYPAVHRHISTVVAEAVPYARLVEIVRSAGGALVENVELLDIYKGEHIEVGHGSLTLGIVFRSREQTLTEDEINSVLADIRNALSRNAGASFR